MLPQTSLRKKLRRLDASTADHVVVCGCCGGSGVDTASHGEVPHPATLVDGAVLRDRASEPRLRLPSTAAGVATLSLHRPPVPRPRVSVVDCQRSCSAGEAVLEGLLRRRGTGAVRLSAAKVKTLLGDSLKRPLTL
jgi:hypothetical protein